MAQPCGAQARQGPPRPPRFVAPDTQGRRIEAARLEVLEAELREGNLPQAVARLDELLGEFGNAGLVASGAAEDRGSARAGGVGAGTISLGVWLGSLDSDLRGRLRGAIEDRWGEVAERAVRRTGEERAADEVSLLVVARRYPLTRAAVRAIAAAADCSAKRGDFVAGRDLLGKLAIDPKVAAAAPATAQTGHPEWWTLAGKAPEGAGASAVTMTWFGPDRPLGAPRCIPVSEPGVQRDDTGSRSFVAGPDRILALDNRNGSLLWSSAAHGDDSLPTGPAAGDGSRTREDGLPGDADRGAAHGARYEVAALSDVRGLARILVHRLVSDRTDAYTLRAVRASDGMELWSSDDQPELHGLTIASNPAVAGRYVYALAVDRGVTDDRLIMLALDVTDGHLLWRADCGASARRGGGAARGNRARDPVVDAEQPWQHLAAPLVNGDVVVVAPNVGCVIAVERFDGQIRWLRAYVQAEPLPAASPMDPRRRARPPRSARAKDVGSLRPGAQRWTETPRVADGHLVIIAPADSDSVYALDLATGRLEWKTDDLAASTLFGVTDGGNILLADGGGVVALAARTGAVNWSWPAVARLSGPPVIRASRVLLPTARGLIELDAASGKPVSGGARVEPFADALRSERTRAVLREAGILSTFLAPEADEPGPPNE